MVTQDSSAQDNLIVKAIRHPFSVAIIILSIVILIVWSDQRSGEKNEAKEMEGQTSAPIGADSPDGALLRPPSLANSGRDVPKIVEQLGDNAGQTSGAAPGLESLIGGLEAKVKADPGNMNNRILLAQTYNQLGFTEKALKELRTVKSEDSENPQVNLVLGTILSKSTKEEDLKESISILDQVKFTDDRQKYLIEMHKGDAYSSMKQDDKALSHWKTALSLMPESDSRRAVLEQRVQSLSSK